MTGLNMSGTGEFGKYTGWHHEGSKKLGVRRSKQKKQNTLQVTFDPLKGIYQMFSYLPEILKQCSQAILFLIYLKPSSFYPPFLHLLIIHRNKYRMVNPANQL